MKKNVLVIDGQGGMLGKQMVEAVRKLYTSEVFEKLQNPETGLYLESPAYVYGLFQDECNFGKLVQSEI